MTPPYPMHVSVEEARRLFAALLPDLALRPAETVPLRAALGRTLAADLRALASHPSATESALDGVACRETDSRGASPASPVRLRVVGESRAGQPHPGEVGPGECVRIYTGAPLPPGTDAICPVEELSEEDAEGSGAAVLLRRPASPNDVRPEGGDFHAGETVLRAGVRLNPARLALAAALGHGAVPVRRRWRVALLATGDELVTPGAGPLAPGQVYDSNSVGLWALLTGAGCEVVDLGRAPDAPEALRERLSAAGGADLLLTSGGVSMGRYDFMRDLLLGEGEVSFWKVRMRPGGPALCGRWGSLPVFGLPGNPVSSLVVFRVLVQPVLTGEALLTVPARALTPFRRLQGKVAFWRATLEPGRGVRDYGEQGSGVLRSLSEANALVVLSPGEGGVNAEDEVEAVPLL